MKKPAPNQQNLLKMAEETKADFANVGEENNWSAPSTMKYRMLDLIYSGNMESAWKLWELSWPAKHPGNAAFLKEFVQELKSSPHYNDINQIGFQNGAIQKH